MRPSQGQDNSNSGTPTKISAICLKCRYHLHLKVGTSPAGQASQPFSDHLHHLVYYYGKHKGGNTDEEVTTKGQVVESFHFECSYPRCPFRITVGVASPLLSGEMVQLLTDPVVLQKRTDEALAADPERLEGVARPLPITVLMNLRTYVWNALQSHQQGKSISAINKRFMTSFGVDGKPCQGLLEFLGFTFKVSTCIRVYGRSCRAD